MARCGLRCGPVLAVEGGMMGICVDANAMFDMSFKAMFVSTLSNRLS